MDSERLEDQIRDADEMKKMNVLALALAIALSLPVAAQNAGWDATFRAIPDAKNIGDYMRLTRCVPASTAASIVTSTSISITRAAAFTPNRRCSNMRSC